MVVLADSATRKLLHGVVGARGVAADAAVGMSFGLDGPWQLIADLFAGLIHLVLLFQALAAAIGHGFEALGYAIQGLFAGIVAGVGSLAHLLVLPFGMLWRGLQAAVAGIGDGFEGMWHGIQGFFASIVAGIGSAPHMFVLPFEVFGRWIQAAAAGTSHCFDGMWHIIQGFFANVVAALPVAAHGFVLPFEAFWRWLRAAAAAALPYVLVIAAILCVLALVWLSWPFLFSAAPLIGLALVGVVGCCGLLLLAAAVLIGRALVYAVCYSEVYLLVAAKGVGMVLDRVLPACAQCYVRVTTTMSAPGAAGMDISRAAFESLPELYFQIFRSAGPIVAAAVFCSHPVAWACAAPVAALFLFRALDKRLPQRETCDLPADAYHDVVTDTSDSCSIGQQVSEDDDMSDQSSIDPHVGDHVTPTIRHRIHVYIHVTNICPICALAV